MAVKRYIRTRSDTVPTAPLLLSKRNRRIDSSSVWYIVKKYLKQAQIEKDKLSPHTLRHTFATTLLKQGENILTIKELFPTATFARPSGIFTSAVRT
jgi:site-specific recombinase XerD